MKKIFIETPKYETVQTGVDKIEKWETSDGKLHDRERDAEYHEFYNLKVKQRGFCLEELERATILDLESKEDFLKYKNDYIDSDTELNFDPNDLIYPNTYVFYEVDEAEHSNMYDYGYPEWKMYYATLNDFKGMMLEKIQQMR